MVVNAFSVVAGFAASLRLLVGVALLVTAIWMLARPRADDSRRSLLALLGISLGGLAVLSWPLLYLVLQSFVGIWPDVMCIQGVSRIGTGSTGAVSLLPGLLAALALTKPLVVFAAGSWFVLRGGRPALVAAAIFGAVAVADAAIESAYLWVPKEENVVATGCCSHAAFATPPAEVGAVAPRPTGLSISFFAVGAAVVAALFAGSLGIALAATAVLVPLGLSFLERVAAPEVMHLPYHECAACLVAFAPESVIGIGLFVAGACGVGWAAVARWIGHDEERATHWMRVGRFCVLGSLVFAGSAWVAA